MPAKEQREKLLSNAPFSDILALTNYYNDKKREAQGGQLPKELEEVELAIQDKIITSIRYTNFQSIEQGIALAGCQDERTFKLLIQQLLTQIENNRLNFPELYAAFTECITQGKSESSTDDDKVQLSAAIVERMNSIYAPDIALTCYMVHTLHAVMYKMIEGGAEYVYDKQKEKIEHALRSLTNRLQAVKAKDKDEETLIENFEAAIKFSHHVLVNLKDHRTDTRRCLHRIKIAGLLLLQAAETGAQWHGAVASMGVGAPSALGATYSFMNHVLRRGKQVYYHFHDNKGYFTELIKWRESLETYLVANKFDKAKVFLEKLKANKDLPKYWDNPNFILGAIKILLVTYTLYPEVHNPIIGLLIYYYDNYKPKQEVFCKQIVKQVSFTLIKLLDETTISNPLLKSQVEAIRDKMSDEEKVLYLSYQEAKEISRRNIQYNLAMEAWKQRYEGDIKLYEICLLVSEKGGSEALTKEQQTYIGKLHSGVSSNQLSSWGIALLSTFSHQELTQVAVKARLKAFISQNIVASEIGLSREDIKSTAQDPNERSFILDIIQLAIREGTANVGKMKVSDEQKILLKTNFDNFITAVFKSTPETTTELHYYNDVTGCRIMQPHCSNQKGKEDAQNSSMILTNNNISKQINRELNAENQINKTIPNIEFQQSNKRVGAQVVLHYNEFATSSSLPIIHQEITQLEKRYEKIYENYEAIKPTKENSSHFKKILDALSELITRKKSIFPLLSSQPESNEELITHLRTQLANLSNKLDSLQEVVKQKIYNPLLSDDTQPQETEGRPLPISQSTNAGIVINKVKNVHYGNVYDSSLHVKATSRHAEEIASVTDKLADNREKRAEKRRLSQLANQNKPTDEIPSAAFTEVDNFHYGDKHSDSIHFTEILSTVLESKNESIGSNNPTPFSLYKKEQTSIGNLQNKRDEQSSNFSKESIKMITLTDILNIVNNYKDKEVEVEELFKELAKLGNWTEILKVCVFDPKLSDIQRLKAEEAIQLLIAKRDELDKNFYKLALMRLMGDDKRPATKQRYQYNRVPANTGVKSDLTGYKLEYYKLDVLLPQSSIQDKHLFRVSILAPGSRDLISDIDTSIQVECKDISWVKKANWPESLRGIDLDKADIALLIQASIIEYFNQLNLEMIGMTSAENRDSNVYSDGFSHPMAYPKFNEDLKIEGKSIIESETKKTLKEFYATYKQQKQQYELAASLISLRLYYGEREADWKRDFINYFLTEFPQGSNYGAFNDLMKKVMGLVEIFYKHRKDSIKQFKDNIVFKQFYIASCEKALKATWNGLIPQDREKDFYVYTLYVLYVQHMNDIAKYRHEIANLKQDIQILKIEMAPSPEKLKGLKEKLAKFEDWLKKEDDEDRKESYKSSINKIEQGIASLSSTQYQPNIKKYLQLVKRLAEELIKHQQAIIKAHLFAHEAYINYSAVYHTVEWQQKQGDLRIDRRHVLLCSVLQQVGFRLLHAKEYLQEGKEKGEVLFRVAKYEQRIADMLWGETNKWIGKGLYTPSSKILLRLKPIDDINSKEFNDKLYSMLNLGIQLVEEVKKKPNKELAVCQKPIKALALYVRYYLTEVKGEDLGNPTEKAILARYKGDEELQSEINAWITNHGDSLLIQMAQKLIIKTFNVKLGASSHLVKEGMDCFLWGNKFKAIAPQSLQVASEQLTALSTIQGSYTLGKK